MVPLLHSQALNFASIFDVRGPAMDSPEVSLTRRQIVNAAAAVAAAGVLPLGSLPASAALDDMQAEIRKLVGAAGVKAGRVKVSIPELTENGNATPITVSVESPMTEANYVRAVHIFSEKNPVAYIARLGIGPWAGKAQVSTSIRVADTQTFTIVAEMSDGTFWSGQGTTEVTAPACIDDSDRPR